MTEWANTSASSTATDARTARPASTTGVSRAGAAGDGIRSIRRLVVFNLGLVALQALSAGFFLSGYGHAVTAHAVVAIALQLGAFVQALTAVVLWRRGRLPAQVAGFSIGLLAMVFLQAGLGYNKRYWLHVPVGVGIFGGLTRQVNRLDALSRATETRA